MLNSVGLQNPGVDRFLSVLFALAAETGHGGHCQHGGSTLEDYAAMAERLDTSDVHMVELNISCPRVKEEEPALAPPVSVEKVTAEVRRRCASR